MKQLSTRYDSLISHYLQKNPGLTPSQVVEKINLYDALDVSDETLTRMVSRFMKAEPAPRLTYDGDYLHVVIGCLHFPFHNPFFWGAFLNFVAWLDQQGVPYKIHLDGDIADLHSISRHAKGRITIPGLTLGLEYALTNKELDNLDQASGKALSKFYQYGNHEAWYGQHMAEVDNAKLGEEVIKSPKEALRLEERGYQVDTDYKNGQYWVNDNTIIQHGTHLGLHAAHQAVQKMKCNVIFPHTHRATVWTERTQLGKILYGMNIGWGGDVHAKAFSYMNLDQRRTWQNAFGLLHVEEDQITPELVISADSKSFWAFGKKFSS